MKDPVCECKKPALVTDDSYCFRCHRPTPAYFEGKKATSTVYLCGVDYQHEMDEGLANYFLDVEELMEAKPCWEECGIVELELDEKGHEIRHTWLVEQKLPS